MQESILIKKAEIILPDGIKEGDLYIKNGKIKEIDWHIDKPAELIIKEKGLTVIPGCIDTHVHFRDPGLTHKESIYTASRAAAAGGITTFFDMPNTIPHATTVESIEEKKQIAKETSLINANFYIGATSENLKELQMVKDVPGIKIFMASTTGNMLLDDDVAIEEIIKNTDKTLVFHSEDEQTLIKAAEKYKGSSNPADHTKMHPPEAALISSQKILNWALKYPDTHFHILHLTTKEEVALLKAKPSNLTTEVCVQSLLLNSPDAYKDLGTYAQMNPPIRNQFHSGALWQALKNGLIDHIVTDHAPHTIKEKEKPFGQAPSGMPGVETSLRLMLNISNQGHCPIPQIVNWMSETPAKRFNLAQKGRLEVGYDADIAIIDRKKKSTIENGKLHTKCNWSAFDGWETTGLNLMTICGGNLIYRENEFFEV